MNVAARCVTVFNLPTSEKFPACEGNGLQGCDPIARTCVDASVDTNVQTVRTDYGHWSEADRTTTG